MLRPLIDASAAKVALNLPGTTGLPATVTHAGTPLAVDLWGDAVDASAWERWTAPAP